MISRKRETGSSSIQMKKGQRNRALIDAFGIKNVSQIKQWGQVGTERRGAKG